MPPEDPSSLLRKGASTWNAWRSETPEMVPDLTGFHGVRAQLDEVNLERARLANANLTRARLARARLGGSDLRGATLIETDLTSADLKGADLEGAQLAGAKLTGANLQEANLRGAVLTVAHLGDACLRRANLERADLREAILIGASLEGCCLEGAELLYTRLESANLAGAVGLSASQLEVAVIDVTTRLDRGPDRAGALEDISRRLHELRRRMPESDTVSEVFADELNAAVRALEALGYDVGALAVPTEARRRDVASWNYTAGGEAFELAPGCVVERRELDARLDRLLRRFQRRHDSADALSFEPEG